MSRLDRLLYVRKQKERERQTSFPPLERNPAWDEEDRQRWSRYPLKPEYDPNYIAPQAVTEQPEPPPAPEPPEPAPIIAAESECSAWRSNTALRCPRDATHFARFLSMVEYRPCSCSSPVRNRGSVATAGVIYNFQYRESAASPPNCRQPARSRPSVSVTRLCLR